MKQNQQNQQQPYGYDPELVKQLKDEIITDLKAQREWQENYYEEVPPMGYGKNYRPQQYNPEMMQQMRKDIVKDIENRRETQKKYYEDYYEMDYGRYGRPPMGRGMGMGRGLGRMFGWCPAPPPMPRMDYDYDYDYNYMPRMGRNNRNQYWGPVDYDWWTDWEEYENQRNLAMLRQTLRNELRQLNKTYQKMQPPKDPQVRMILSDLLQEARQQGMNINDVLQGLEMGATTGFRNASMGYKESIWDKIGGPFKDVDRRSFGYGAGAALLGLSALPALGKSIRPLVRKAMEEFMDVYDNAQGVFSQAKEELEDIVAEASFNKMKDSLDNSTKGDPPTDK